MNKFITGVIGLVAITALIISLAKVGGNSQPVESGDFGSTGTRFPNGLSTNTTSPVPGELRTTTLTVTGTSTIATTTSSGVSTVTRGTTSLVTASTTHWATQPMASSTLASAFCSLTGSTTASVIGFAKASTAFATTTVLATTTIAANAQGSINALATTTFNAVGSVLGRLSVNDRYFGPSDFLVLWQEGGAVGTFSPVGRCEAVFLVP